MTEQEHFTKTADAEEAAMMWFDKHNSDCTYINEPFEFSPNDGYLLSGNTSYIVEAKVRKKYTYEQIESFGGSFLEFKKLNGIINKKNTTEDLRQILYFNFFKEKVIVYKLSSNPNDYQWELKWLRKNNFSSESEMEWKFVAKMQDKDIIQIKSYK